MDSGAFTFQSCCLGSMVGGRFTDCNCSLARAEKKAYRLDCFMYKPFGFAPVFLFEGIMDGGYDWECVFLELVKDRPLYESAFICGFVVFFCRDCRLLGALSL